MIGQAALHHVHAVRGAGFDGGQALTRRAAGHARQRLHALVARRDLEDLGEHALSLAQRLGKGARGHKAAAQLERQFFRHVAERLEFLHVFAHALEVAAKKDLKFLFKLY